MKTTDFIKNIVSGDTVQATETFNALLSKKALEVMEERKVAVAESMFNKMDEEVLDEAKKIIHKYTPEGGEHSAKIYRDPEYDEYQVHYYKGNKHMGEDAVSYHDDKDDAVGTCKAEVDRLNSKK